MAESAVSALLVELLGISDGDVVAFVGGGGKSTLVLGTGRELAEAGRPVVMATTTKMGSDQIPQWATVCQSAPEVQAALEAREPVYLLHRAEGSKVIGVPPRLVDAIAADERTTIVVEADGSRRRPFKAPGPHEPVIPLSATLVVVVVGIDAVGQPIATACHRPERVAALTGRSVTDLVRPQDIACVASHPRGGRQAVPSGVRLLLALTKVESRHGESVEEIRSRLTDELAVVVIENR